MHTSKPAINMNQQDFSNKETLQDLKVYDTQNNLIGNVKHIIRDENNKLQVVFALPEQEKPLFRVSRQTVREVNLEEDYIIVALNATMRQELQKHSHNSFEWIDNESLEDSDDLSQTFDGKADNYSNLDEVTIRLLEERLKVEHSSKKVGDVVVRKVIETKTVEVPVRQEKLIVEQVQGDKTENLAEIDLSSSVIKGAALSDHPADGNEYTVYGEFMTPEAASEILKAISLQRNHGCQKVKIELVVNSSQQQQDYQMMFNRCTDSTNVNKI
jgi:stress response protein YsnF